MASPAIFICGGGRENPVPVPLPDDFKPGMSGVQCKCGRFMSNVRPVVEISGSGYWRGESIHDVRGDCSRCGSDVQAESGHAWSWDAWFEG